MSTHYKPALIVVDVQEDFCPPHGSLAVPDGRAVVPVVNELLDLPFAVRVATRDWHPATHVSFAANHPSSPDAGSDKTVTITHPASGETYAARLWPVHCVAHTPGAALLAGLRTGRLDRVVDKGRRADREMYSAFCDPFGESDSGLEALLLRPASCASSSSSNSSSNNDNDNDTNTNTGTNNNTNSSNNSNGNSNSNSNNNNNNNNNNNSSSNNNNNDTNTGTNNSNTTTTTTITNTNDDAPVTHVFVVGLAFDFCVRDTAIHAAQRGFVTYVVTDATRAVFPDRWDRVARQLDGHGVGLVHSTSDEVARVRALSSEMRGGRR